jgi:hypothetical protein
MSTENYPTDDRTVPRNWPEWKKNLTFDKKTHFGWVGNGTNYTSIQAFLDAELPDGERMYVEHQLYRSEVMHLEAKLVNDGTNLLVRKTDSVMDPWVTKTKRPKYELGVPLYDALCHCFRMYLSQNPRMVQPDVEEPDANYAFVDPDPEVETYSNAQEYHDKQCEKADASFEAGLWLTNNTVDVADGITYGKDLGHIIDGKRYRIDDVYPSNTGEDATNYTRNEFFDWCRPKYDFADNFESLHVIDKEKHIIKIVNPTWFTFIHDEDFDVFAYQEANNLPCRYGGKYEMDGKIYTCWRFKKYGHGQGHYSIVEEIEPAGEEKDRRAHKVWRDKSTMPFPDADWFPGAICKIIDRGGDPNYAFSPSRHRKLPIPDGWDDYENRIFPDWDRHRPWSMETVSI